MAVVPKVITMGRVSIDVYPEQIGRLLEDVETFSKSVGGSPTNVAIAAARHGTPSAVVTKVGDDAFGRYIRRELESDFGVDTRWVSVDPDLRTPLAFCEIHPPDDFPLLFYREPRAPDMNLSWRDVPLPDVVACDLFWTTGVGLSGEPSRSATLAAMEVRRSQRPDAETVHDLDYRPMLWSSASEAREMAQRAVDSATVVVGNIEEVEMATGTADPELAAEALLDRGVRVAIVKRGGEGLLARTSASESVEIPPIPVEVKNGLGAGDAFGGALCHGLVNGWDLERTLGFANAAGAIVASRMRCSVDMPVSQEVDDLLAERSITP